MCSTIAIVGGGAAGISILAQLVNSLVEDGCLDARIILIDKSPRIGPGLAYGTLHDSNILNMRYQKMSILPDEPDDLASWIMRNQNVRDKYPDFDPYNDPFPPRSLYGLYLEDTFNKALRSAKARGIDIEIICDELTDVVETATDVYLEFQSGRAVRTDKTILALGNFAPTTYKQFQNLDGYFESFWPDARTLRSIPKDESVTILGTRLTAIDAAVTILGNGHKGKVRLVSRGGLLPKIQSAMPALTAPYKESILRKVAHATKDGRNPLRLSALMAIMKAEIEHAHFGKIDWSEILNPAGEAVEILRRDVHHAKTYKLNWQGVLVSTSDIIEDLWRRLLPEDKREFVERYNSIWFVYRHCMPLKNAERLLQYIDGGQLEIHGGLEHAEYDDQSSMFVLKYRQSGRLVDLRSRYLINATDVGLKLDCLGSRLIDNLLRSHTIQPSEHGGIEVDFETCGVARDGEISDKLYSIGFLTKGVHFYTNDVARIAAHAKRVVADITSQIAAPAIITQLAS